MNPISNKPVLSDFQYTLPEGKIAKYPLKDRDLSKLLVLEKGQVRHHQFTDISDILPEKSIVFFNDTKVIPARLFFTKDTGAAIEIFLLNPELPTKEIALAMKENQCCTWSCVIGNLKKWKDGNVLRLPLKINGTQVILNALLKDRAKKWVEFFWDDPKSTFATIVEAAGEVPLPPYFHRKPEANDKQRYQTVYSKMEGAVAAPTAGLHFTKKVLDKIKARGIGTDYLTLHVSAGTFQPVKHEQVLDHPMHSEQMVVSKNNISLLAEKNAKIIAVGTTSMRTLESLYWFGVKLLKNQNQQFFIEKLAPYSYQADSLPGRQESMQAIIDYMNEHNLEQISGATEIFIFPGYDFKVCNGLITNFHMPGSTLIMLIAAFVGEKWRELYRHALEKDYRFLSYGDSSLLLP